MTNRNRLISGATCLLLAPVAVLAGCTSSTTPAAKQASAPAQPRMATYRCEEGAEIRIENFGSMVRVHPPADELASSSLAAANAGDPTAGEAVPVELAAAPPGQQSRYGANGYALVLEGNEALWMDAGEPPLTCMR